MGNKHVKNIMLKTSNYYKYKHWKKIYKKSIRVLGKYEGGESNMLTRFLKGILNGIIAFIVLTIIVAILALLPVVAFIGGILSPFVVWIAVLVGVLTFLGAIPDYWPNFNL